MMTKENKPVLIGAGVCILTVLIVQFGFISSSWADAEANASSAKDKRDQWDSNFKGGKDMLPKPEGEKLLAENKKLLDKNLATLTQIEMGKVKGSLAQFTEAAAGGGDKKNYLDTKRKQIAAKYSTRPKFGTGATDLGIVDKAVDDPVAVNLLRLFVVDSLLGACVRSEVDSVTSLKFKPVGIVEFTDEEKAILAPEADDSKRTPGAKADAAEPKAGRMVQFPLEARVNLPEKQAGKLLFELQKPSDGARGYLSIRGFHIFVKDSKSGMVEMVILASGLLDEKVVSELGIEVKGGRPGSGPRGGARSGEIKDLY